MVLSLLCVWGNSRHHAFMKSQLFSASGWTGHFAAVAGMILWCVNVKILLSLFVTLGMFLLWAKLLANSTKKEMQLHATCRPIRHVRKLHAKALKRARKVHSSEVMQAKATMNLAFSNPNHWFA